MSRNIASIQSAFSKVSGTQSESQIKGFPPGHFVGFFLSISGGQIVVSPGEANVAGHAVVLKSSATVEENVWAVSREAQNMYYIYLKRDGMFWVDNQDPLWVSSYNGFYHPILMYRYLGKVFNDSTGKIIYKLSAHYNQQSSVVVGAKGFTGYMDYECDGVDDQEEINLALKFCSEAGEIKKVSLKGTFYISDDITMLSNTGLVGDGAHIYMDNLDYGITSVGTALSYKENVELVDITIEQVATNTTPLSLFRGEYTKNLRITNCEFKNSFRGAITVIMCTGIISGNHIWWDDGPKYTTGAFSAIFLQTSDGMRVMNNEIGPSDPIPIAAIFSGINNYGNNDEIIKDNYIHDLISTDLSEGLVINGRCIVSGNRINNCYGLEGSIVSGIGIEVVGGLGGVDSFVETNYCKDNGSLMAYGGCESAVNPPYLKGDTDDSHRNSTFAGSSATVPYSGSYCYLFTKTTASGAGAGWSFFHTGTATAGLIHGLVGGCEYKFTGYFKVPSGVGTASGMLMSVDDTGGTGGGSSSRTALVDTYDAWQEVTVTKTLLSTATTVVVYVGATSSATLNFICYVDQVSMIPMGVHNEHAQNFVDTTTGTRATGNSWQFPFEA